MIRSKHRYCRMKISTSFYLVPPRRSLIASDIEYKHVSKRPSNAQMYIVSGTLQSNAWILSQHRGHRRHLTSWNDCDILRQTPILATLASHHLNFMARAHRYAPVNTVVEAFILTDILPHGSSRQGKKVKTRVGSSTEIRTKLWI